VALPLCRTTALELVYLRSLGSTGYVALTMAVCIGCLRAVTLGDPTAIVWLDVSPTVWLVLVAQLAFGAFADAMVWAVERKGLRHCELPVQFAAGHPLSNTPLATSTSRAMHSPSAWVACSSTPSFSRSSAVHL
jgi:hypothetical protein